ncbi:hypothetical protein [Streptococcus pyogenes NS88.2]|nr:hypothetical protein [Streptococcus pyogenes NS88.2]
MILRVRQEFQSESLAVFRCDSGAKNAELDVEETAKQLPAFATKRADF